MKEENQRQIKNQFLAFEKELISNGFKVSSKNRSKPWGGYFNIDSSCKELFIKKYFVDHIDYDLQRKKIHCKILMILPNQRLSWQYHDRREELWIVVSGSVKLTKSFDDIEPPYQIVREGEIIHILSGERHRLSGTEMTGIIAEIWIHTNSKQPSNEKDIFRITDDYGR